MKKYTPKFYRFKRGGCKGVKISQACSHDAEPHTDRTVQEVGSIS